MCDISALILQWQSGDERAGEALYSHYREPIFRLAYGLLGDSADAEEVAQDALAYALNRIGQYDAARSSFSTCCTPSPSAGAATGSAAAACRGSR